jgi:hypothetical protein
MTNFVRALEDKMRVLNSEREEHMNAIQSIDAKLAVLNELYLEEEGVPVKATSAPEPKKKRRGRPKGSTKKTTVGKKEGPKATETEPASGGKKFAPNFGNVYEEAVRDLESRDGGGSSKELQERLVGRFNPQPRPVQKLGPGITAGTKKQVEAAAGGRRIDSSISIDEGE